MSKKTKLIPAGEFKAKCLKLMDEVQASNTSVVITKHGRPVVIVSPYVEETRFPIGSLKGTVQIKGDIVGPTGETWDVERDDDKPTRFK